jgi:hypothetical protein
VPEAFAADLRDFVAKLRAANPRTNP